MHWPILQWYDILRHLHFSLHDALPIFEQHRSLRVQVPELGLHPGQDAVVVVVAPGGLADRKSTRLNSSHVEIAYAVFCLKKKRDCIVDRGVAVIVDAYVDYAIDTLHSV